MGPFYKGQRVHIVAGSYKKNGAGTYIEECGKVSCRVKVDHDIASERTIREASIRAISPAKSSFWRHPTEGDGTTPYEGSGQWSPTRTKLYRQKAEQAERSAKKKKKEEILRELKSLKATMLERIKAVEKEIMDLNID
jgi:hypothetical protein